MARKSKRTDATYSNGWRNLTKIVLRPLIPLLMKRDWHGQENFPARGGMILAANHLSYADVLALCLYTDGAGRYPVFLAKSSLFKIPVLGRVIAGTGQLPVNRQQVDAALVLKDAATVIGDDDCVIFYPEGTVTRDPALWPMVSRTGVARLALTTGVPVIPVASWGAQDILPYGSIRPHLVPRKPVHILAGPPVDLSAFDGEELTTKTLRAATDLIMAEVTALLAKLRGETPPAEPYHPAIARRQLRQDLRALQESGTAGPVPASETPASETPINQTPISETDSSGDSARPGATSP
jgi:1-acyl-sn-glycerol-3-phosphate acyltransferase